MGDILTAISVYFFFLAFLLNEVEKEITGWLEKIDIEPAQTKKRDFVKSKLKKLLFLKAIPISLIFIISFYSILPETLKIISSSKISWWNFDALKTLFVFIEICFGGLIVFSVFKTCKVIRGIKKLNKKV